MNKKTTITGRCLPPVYMLLAVLLIAACTKINNQGQHNVTYSPVAHSITAGNPSGNLQVSTLAGDGAPNAFNAPNGIAIDSSGNIYVTDNNRIQKITPAGSVMPFAGGTTAGFLDTTVGGAAKFNNPAGLAVDAAGNVFVADRGNNRIRKITPAGVVSTVAGSDSAAFFDGSLLAARFNHPSGIAVDATGLIYVADTYNYCVRIIDITGNAVGTVAGTPQAQAQTQLPPSDGLAGFTPMYKPTGVALDAAGIIYVTDSNCIRKIASGQLTTLAGTQDGTYQEGTGATARFNNVNGLAFDGAGNLYVADKGNSCIRVITPVGSTSTFAGIPKSPGFWDGSITRAQFNAPAGVVIDKNGFAYVADAGNNRIRLIRAYTLLATGASSSFWVKADNSLWVSGYNGYGQLGDGTTIDKNTPVKVMDNVLAIAAGDEHTLILKKDNSLWTCGYNGYGQLGDGTNVDKSTPVKVMDNVLAIAAGGYHSLVIKTDFSLWTFGMGAYGELGNGTTTTMILSPVKVMDNVQAVSAGEYFSLILKKDNTLWGVGHNFNGELGDGTITNRTTPVKMMDNVRTMTAGYFYSLILKTDNSLWGNGDNNGKLGDGTFTERDSPIKIMDNVKTMAGGFGQTLIVKTDNSLWGTGTSGNGQLGAGATNLYTTPIKIMDNVQAVAAGYYFSLMLKTDNTPWGAGYNTTGQLGDGTLTQRNSWTRVQLP